MYYIDDWVSKWLLDHSTHPCMVPHSLILQGEGSPNSVHSGGNSMQEADPARSFRGGCYAQSRKGKEN